MDALIERVCQVIENLASNKIISRKIVMVAMGLGAFCYCLQQISSLTLDKYQFYALMAVLILICGALPAYGVWRQADIDKINGKQNNGNNNIT